MREHYFLVGDIVLLDPRINTKKMQPFFVLNTGVSRVILSAALCFLLSNFIPGLLAADANQEPKKKEEEDDCGISKNGKIVGGKPVSPGDHPWMVSIHERWGKKFNHVCGGTLIDKEWLVTAAHCVPEKLKDKPEYYRAVVGLYKQSKQDEDQVEHLNISKIIVHEDYNKTVFRNDIALLKTKKPIHFENNPYVGKICWPDSEEEPTGKAIAAGWGHMQFKGQISDVLLDVEVPIVPVKQCQRRYGKYVTVTQICAGEENKDSCQADSGGPLLQHDEDAQKSTLIGIVSFGLECGKKKYPGVYTNFAKYLDWVKEKMTE